MTLVEEMTQEFKKVGLELKITKEYNGKYNGVLVDVKSNEEVPYELNKYLQHSEIKNHIKWCRGYVDLAIKFKKLQNELKEENTNG